MLYSFGMWPPALHCLHNLFCSRMRPDVRSAFTVLVQRFDSRSFALGGAASTRFVPSATAETIAAEPAAATGPRAAVPPPPPPAQASAADARATARALPASQSSFAIPNAKEQGRSGRAPRGGMASQSGPATQLGGPASQLGYGQSSQGSFQDFDFSTQQGASQGYGDLLTPAGRDGALPSFAMQAHPASQQVPLLPRLRVPAAEHGLLTACCPQPALYLGLPPRAARHWQPKRMFLLGSKVGSYELLKTCASIEVGRS